MSKEMRRLIDEFNKKFLIKEESKKYSTILIFGPQGVGKSTLTIPLGKKLGMKVISSDEFIDQGKWETEKTAKQGWLTRKDNEFDGMVNFLNNYLGQSVILDIGGSHGVWEGNHLSEIKKMISSYPNTFLMVPSNDMVKSKEYLRKNLLKRESGIKGAIDYWKKLLSKDENFVNQMSGEDKEISLKRLEKIKNGDTSEAKYQINRMQKRLDIINSGNVDWKEFDIDDEDSENVKFAPDEFHDYSNYFITNMKNSGIANHVVYNLDKNTEDVINEIIKVLK
jgi:shikimate kinase